MLPIMQLFVLVAVHHVLGSVFLSYRQYCRFYDNPQDEHPFNHNPSLIIDMTLFVV